MFGPAVPSTDSTYVGAPVYDLLGFDPDRHDTPRLEWVYIADKLTKLLHPDDLDRTSCGTCYPCCGKKHRRRCISRVNDGAYQRWWDEVVMLPDTAQPSKGSIDVLAEMVEVGNFSDDVSDGESSGELSDTTDLPKSFHIEFENADSRKDINWFERNWEEHGERMLGHASMLRGVFTLDCFDGWRAAKVAEIDERELQPQSSIQDKVDEEDGSGEDESEWEEDEIVVDDPLFYHSGVAIKDPVHGEFGYAPFVDNGPCRFCTLSPTECSQHRLNTPQDEDEVSLDGIEESAIVQGTRTRSSVQRFSQEAQHLHPSFGGSAGANNGHSVGRDVDMGSSTEDLEVLRAYNEVMRKDRT